ncbi:hypothetical protein PITC_040120 [Penicillium italicum]|uniref:Nephrocystin 3-like N-terminal domain-containing protein n=1 Tax=Penicillium italicum TaxID=40296 RepID=A0A0A2L1P4_PENIT|nr:hypothetical protein PITC_040120 [Penicillium italicum]
MSFGFGVGDFLATLKLADELKKRFAQAPSEFKAISGEIKSLWAVLHDLNDIPKEGLSVRQKSEMESIVQKGREVLLEIEEKLSKSNVLAFATSNWKSKALRAWSRINWDPAEVKSLRSRITSCISLFKLVMGKINQELTLEIGAEVHSMKENHETQLRNEMLPWISEIDSSTRQHKVFNMRREGAGKWFLESEQFLLWIACKMSKTLLCTGVPGAGKAVLASILIDTLEEKFACDDSGNPGLHGSISDLYSQRQHSSSHLSEKEVQKELELVISRCGEVFFLIDALDECLDVRVRRQFLIWIEKILTFNDNTNIKVLVTTRHDDKFGNAFLSKDLTLEIKASREGVESFLDANLDYLPMFIQRNPNLWGYIRNQIIESAGAMFLLGHLYYSQRKVAEEPESVLDRCSAWGIMDWL